MSRECLFNIKTIELNTLKPSEKGTNILNTFITATIELLKCVYLAGKLEPVSFIHNYTNRLDNQL